MTREAERVLEAALSLPQAERAELAAILADSVGDGASDAEIEAAWVAEAKRRLESVRSGASQTLPAEDVARRLRAMIEQARTRSAG